MTTPSHIEKMREAYNTESAIATKLGIARSTVQKHIKKAVKQ